MSWWSFLRRNSPGLSSASLILSTKNFLAASMIDGDQRLSGSGERLSNEGFIESSWRHFKVEIIGAFSLHCFMHLEIANPRRAPTAESGPPGVRQDEGCKIASSMKKRLGQFKLGRIYWLIFCYESLVFRNLKLKSCYIRG